MRVLYVEDSESLRRSVQRALRHAGYAADVAADGEEGLDLIQTNDYDAIILDVMMPRVDGLSLLRRLRSSGNTTHILLLTARDTVANRVEGLRAGADDYLIKPFSLEELLARVDALCRRAYGTKADLLRIGALELDFSSRRVRKEGVPIEVSPREWRLLDYMARRLGEVVTRTEIETHIYDEQVEPMSNVVDAAVYALRRKLGPEIIRTRRGLGYVMEARES